MKTYNHNGDEWYVDAQPLWLRAARWLVSTGLDSPHWGPDGYSYRSKARSTIRLSLRAREHRSRLWAVFYALCPLSFLGHWIVVQPFGLHISRRTHYLCIQWPGHHHGWRVYASRDATPSSAHWWLTTPPNDVLRAARTTVERRNAERAAREAVQ